MDLSALLLSRLQFAFTISFHIIFPSFTIGLAAWLTLLEALNLKTGRPAYRAVFEFWLKVFGVAFGLGVVSGIVMAFQFGSNWSELSRMSGPIERSDRSRQANGLQSRAPCVSPASAL
jgi:cytochrome d ubiquinol oxidase subunit I